jgi:hypothetical protein
MIDIDEILAAAIRNALQQVNGPAPQSQFRVEVETARRIRVALEREGIIITPSRPMPPDATAVAPSTQAPALAPDV